MQRIVSAGFKTQALNPQPSALGGLHLGLKALTGIAIVLALVALATRGAQAHKPITSKYGYNEDVFPILRDRCGRCHVDGGAAPMSLLKYKDAVPWAESIREELVSEKMPPWYADPAGPAMKGGHKISPRELDTIITWATGGTPEGDRSKSPEPIVASLQWTAGLPDHMIAMESPHTLPAGMQEETCEFTLQTGLSETRWVKAVDLLPGTSSMVRDATITIDEGTVLAAWVPGSNVDATPSGTGFRLPPGAKLHLKIHYKKSWQDEQIAKSDRSVIGLYFTEAPAAGHEVRALSLDASARDSESTHTFGGSLAGPAKVLAVRPTLDRAYAALDVHAVGPDGGRVPLLRLRAPRPGWLRRYWLASPVDLPSGSRLEVTVIPTPPDPDEVRPQPSRSPLQVAVDFVAQ